MGRAPCCDNGDRNKGAWTKEEDVKLIQYIQTHGEGCWRSLPKAAGLLRCGKSCRLRWINYLRPDLKRGNFSEDEEDLIFKLHALLGNKWSLIAGRLPGRTDNEIKNYWNSHLKRKLVSRGVDPLTHRPFHRTPRRPSAEPNVAQLETYEDKCSGETTVEDCFESDHRSEQISSKPREDLPNLNLELSITSPPSINDHTVSSICDHSIVQSKPAGCYGRRSSAGDENGLNPAGCYVDFPRTMLLLR